jgi:hypothetical protein
MLNQAVDKQFPVILQIYCLEGNGELVKELNGLYSKLRVIDGVRE